MYTSRRSNTSYIRARRVEGGGGEEIAHLDDDEEDEAGWTILAEFGEMDQWSLSKRGMRGRGREAGKGKRGVAAGDLLYSAPLRPEEDAPHAHG
jgi:hypothetical protein